MAESIAELQAKIRALLATVAGNASKHRLREIHERLGALLGSPGARDDANRVAEGVPAGQS